MKRASPRCLSWFRVIVACVCSMAIATCSKTGLQQRAADGGSPWRDANASDAEDVEDGGAKQVDAAIVFDSAVEAGMNSELGGSKQVDAAVGFDSVVDAGIDGVDGATAVDSATGADAATDSGGSGGCGPTPPGMVGTCSSSDPTCAGNEYCDYKSCAGDSYECMDGHWVEHALCRNRCTSYSTDCTRASSVLTRQLTGECAILVRVSADGAVLKSYTVESGTRKATTQEQALNQLLAMESINWSAATTIASGPRIYAFSVTNGATQYTAYVSALSGDVMLMTAVPVVGGQGRFMGRATWAPGSDLGTSCASGKDVPWGADSVGPSDRTIKLGQVVSAVEQSGVFEALAPRGCTLHGWGLTSINVEGTEALIFVLASCAS
jgi:hypothetical protein